MADGIQISTQVLIDTAAKVRTINSTLDDKLTNINNKMQSLSSTWNSDAAEEIRKAMLNMRPKFDHYKEVIDSYAKFLDTTAQSYESTETAIHKNAEAFK